MHLRVIDPESLMMIRDRKPRYLVSEIDEIEKIYLENTFYDPNAKLNGRQ